MLIEYLLALLERSVQGLCARRESRERALVHALAFLVTMGRRTISRVVCTLGRKDASDWSAEYKLYSRSPWNPDDAFDPVIAERLARQASGPIALALDDTRLWRSGRKVPGARWLYDPLSPAFHANLRWGLRMLHAALLFPHYREGQGVPCRAVPVRFRLTPSVKRPGKNATDEERREYRQASRTDNLSVHSVRLVEEVRQRLDRFGAGDRLLIVTGDASFCNRTVMRSQIDRVVWLSRTRKDARLCFAAAPPSRRRYAVECFTPEQVRGDDTIPYHDAEVFYGGERRRVRYKEVKGVLWRRGAGVRPLRLIVVAPLPYKPSPLARTHYRQPAYLLSTDLELEAAELLQIYLDRWQIEVCHREMKDLFGVGDAQVRSEHSVARHPAFAAAAYSLLLVAGMQAFGPAWNSALYELPRWRRKVPQRPSAYDLLARLRRELLETPDSRHHIPRLKENLTLYAYT